MHGDRLPGTKLELGKMKMISSQGSFADEAEEEAFNLARTQLHEALASERNAKRTAAQARAIMHDIKSSRGGYYPQGANKKGPEAEKGKGKGQVRTETIVVERWDSRRTRQRVKLEQDLTR